ncbi:MAG: hypothetical protein DRI84_06720 [Bacteroidetes bacterium]|nr:MAG: hypothetical protein DRI84_06720 [Bacteroidota bacterium]
MTKLKLIIYSIMLILLFLIIFKVFNIFSTENIKQINCLSGTMEYLDNCINTNLNELINPSEDIENDYDLLLNIAKDTFNTKYQIFNEYNNNENIINVTTQQPNFATNPNLLYRAGILLAASGNSELGYKYLYRSYSLNTNNIDALYASLLASFNFSKLDDERLKEYEEKVNNQSKIAFVKAVYFLHKKDYEKVVEICRKHNESFNSKRYIDYYELFAQLYLENNESQIEELANGMFDLWPDNIDWLIIVSRGFQKIKNYEKAYEGFNRAIILGCTSINVYTSAAFCAYKSNNNIEALRYFKYMQAKEPNNIDYRMFVINDLMKLKYADAAMDAAWQLTKLDFLKGTNYMQIIENHFIQ